MIDPRYKNLKMNVVPDGGAQSAPMRPKGGLGGPPRRRSAWDALKVIGGTLQDLDGSMGYGNREAAMQGLRNRNEQIRLQQENEARQAKMAEFAKTLTPEQQTLFGLNPNAAIEGMTQQAFSQPKPQDPFVVNGRVIDRNDPSRVVADYSDPKTPTFKTVTTDEGIFQYDPANPQTSMQFLGNAPAKGPLVNVNTGADGNTYKSVSEVPMGQPIPEGLLGGVSIPDDMYAIRAEGGPGFAFAPIPGSAAESKVQAREDSSTIDTLINDYSTLARNKAITARGNTAAENAAAIYSGSFLGRRQDQLGGDLGNIDNYSARSNIEGLSMNALMKMISMSDVSAKAMDSDAEMKAWLSSIKSDNYESALTKLHVLDQSFGSGQAIQNAFENGIIDQKTYQWVTGRAQTDPFLQKMAKKAQRYAALSGDIGADNFTPNETDAVGDLLEFMTPEERALFEGGLQ